MTKDKIKVIKTFYGGMVRDEKSKINGASYNIEELDILSNADYFQAEQIVSADTLPASTEVYGYCSDNASTVYGYGKETAASKVRIVSVATGGADDPGSLATLFTSADATNLAYKISPIVYHKTTETLSNYLYFLTKTAGNVVKLCRFEISAGSDFSVVGTLTGLDGSFDRVSMKVLFGELIVANGTLIAKVDKDGVFTNNAFTMPKDWEVVDFIPVSDVCLILSRYLDKSVNFCKGYWWDLTSTAQVDDSFNIPSGGPQWIINHQENIMMFCANNGRGRFFQLSGAYPGAVPQELPGLEFLNIAAEIDQQPISSSKMVAEKDKILYFGVWKTDKTGIYGLGRLDADKPRALFLSKRFNTTSYATHKPTGLYILGPNYYGAYDDNGTAACARCESNNSPSRSSQGIYESILIDDDSPATDKQFSEIVVSMKPQPASTDIDVSFASDYGSYAEYFRGDGTSLNTTSMVHGKIFVTNGAHKKVGRIKLKLISSTTNSPKVTALGLVMSSQSEPANK